MAFCKIIFILFWKCVKLRIRSIILTALEIAVPILVVYLMSYVFNKISEFSSTNNNTTDPSHLFGDTYDIPFSFISGFEVGYAPEREIISNIMKNFEDEIMDLNPSLEMKVLTQKSVDDLDKWMENKTNSLEYFGSGRNSSLGIVFTSVDKDNYVYKYKIRLVDPLMDTNDIGSINYPPIFPSTQVVLDKAILKEVSNKSEKLSVQFTKLPSKNTSLDVVLQILYFFLAFAYLFLVVSLIKDVVAEKESGTKELMKVMGVNSWMIWLHWFVYCMMVQLPVMIVLTYILTVWKTVIHSPFLLVFVLFLLFTINLTIFIFVLSCLFNRMKSAVVYGLMAWFAISAAMYFLALKDPAPLPHFLEIIFGLFPLLNLCWAISSLWSYDLYGEVWTLSRLFTQGYTTFTMSVGSSIVLFIVSSILFSIILLYLDAVFPGPYGVPKPFDFMFSWLKDLFVVRKPYEYSEVNHESPSNFEPVSKNAIPGIILRGLRKEYGFFQKKVAVEKVDLDLYQGEIMALLGHNGAGKTTTMSMITGMTAPSEGVILFEGEDITQDKSSFRRNLGYCPQHNLYFSKLTVLEHLMFFGMLKGMSRSESITNGKHLLLSLNMAEKADTRGAKLSGGMKRRLCLAVALTGDPEVVILDEPTSGLDPQTRRLLWDIILKMRGQRTVLITTHFMEEADVLGDRIAIMDHGRVVCCGTSLFLKKLFGTGYQVHVVRRSPQTSLADITSIFQGNIPQPEVNVVSNVQVDYVIKEEHVDKFPALFSALERQKDSLDIAAVTVTCASLEDVFLKVAALQLKDKDYKHPIISDDFERFNLDSSSNSFPFERHFIFFRREQMYFALFVKRFIHFKRNIVSSLTRTILLTLLFCYIVIATRIERLHREKQKPITLNLGLYPKSSAMFACDDTYKGMEYIAKKVAKSLSGHVKVFSNTSSLNEYLEEESTHNITNYLQGILFALTIENNVTLIRDHMVGKEHARAIAVNFFYNILLQYTNNGTGMIEAVNHPYINTDKRGDCDPHLASPAMLQLNFVSLYVAVLAILFISIFNGFLGFITEERVAGFKHQQFLAGVYPNEFWLVSLIFDFCYYFIVGLILLQLISLFGPMMRTAWFYYILLVIFLQGISGITFTYLYSLLINDQGTSSTVFILLMAFTALLPGLFFGFPGAALLFMSFKVYHKVACLLSLNPVFAAQMCLTSLIRAVASEEYCRVCKEELCPIDKSTVVSMLNKDDVGRILLYLYFLLFTSIFYPLILILLDSGLLRGIMLCLRSKGPDYSIPPDVDDDVAEEIKTVEHLSKDVDVPLQVESLEKSFLCGPKAVNKVSFLVQKGDCFGLLGVNGAGKSTTFKILTAEIMMNKGDALVGGVSVRTDRSYYMSSVGYCPQFDAILPSLSGRETLKIVARMRGIPPSVVKATVTSWLEKMGIMEHANKPCGSYSGGTKRKLSMAMALIGSPEVVLLDEPTTGVDPASRRKLWTVIKEMQKEGQAVVLTSHSMDECEALCTRLTIMVAGSMRCIGNVEYLKAKFGRGYTVLVKLRDHSDEDVAALKRAFDRIFPQNVIKDEHDTLIHYIIDDPNLPLSRLFSLLLRFKQEQKKVEDFSASNTTLEELFLSFASDKKQRKSSGRTKS